MVGQRKSLHQQEKKDKPWTEKRGISSKEWYKDNISRYLQTGTERRGIFQELGKRWTSECKIGSWKIGVGTWLQGKAKRGKSPERFGGEDKGRSFSPDKLGT